MDAEVKSQADRWQKMMTNPTPTELHEDLKPYIYEEGKLGWTCLKHPLVFAIPYTEQMNEMYNESYTYKKAAIEKARAEKNWSSYLYLHERPYRFDAFCEIQDEMDNTSYWESLGSIWIDSENLWQWRDRLDELLECPRPGRRAMMGEDEVKLFAKLPNVFRVYRGHQKINKYGHSWTMSFWQARWFAQRFEPKKAAVVTGLVKKKNVIAVLMGRGEFEVVVHPDNVLQDKDFKVEMPPLFGKAKHQFTLGANRSVHGPWHWEKVYSNALELTRQTLGADERVVELFCIFHDCKRENENDDPQHGPRAAEYLKGIRSELGLTDTQFEKLEYACRHHDNGKVSDDPTIGVCWDADRLDLGRVGIIPKAELLSTEAGKKSIWLI